MKVVFFSDIHGNCYSFEAFLKEKAVMSADKIVFCGDAFGYYYHTNKILTIIQDMHMISLLGNHDQMLLDIINGLLDGEDLVKKYGSVYHNAKRRISEKNINYLKNLLPKKELVLDDLKFGIFHGTPDNPLNGRLYPDTEISARVMYELYDFVILGHTHHKMIRFCGDTVIINPGSLGQQRDGEGCSYLVFDTSTKDYSLRTVSYDITTLVKEINQRDPDNTRMIEVLTRQKAK